MVRGGKEVDTMAVETQTFRPPKFSDRRAGAAPPALQVARVMTRHI